MDIRVDGDELPLQRKTPVPDDDASFRFPHSHQRLTSRSIDSTPTAQGVPRMTLDPSSRSHMAPFASDRQRALMTPELGFHSEQIPPTPMTAYFDAEDSGADFDEGAHSPTISSPPTSSGTWGANTFSAIREESAPPAAADAPVASSSSLRGNHDDEVTGGKEVHTLESNIEELEEDVGEDSTSTSHNGAPSSEGETPSPLTPATPGTQWRPRELTLLRRRSASGLDAAAAVAGGSSGSEGEAIDVSADPGSNSVRSKALEGLGIKGVAHVGSPQHVSSPVDRRFARKAAASRDVFPIAGSASSSQQAQRFPLTQIPRHQPGAGANHASASPSSSRRELRLASSAGPPSFHRTITSPGSAPATATAIGSASSTTPPARSNKLRPLVIDDPSSTGADKAAGSLLTSPSTRLPVPSSRSFARSGAAVNSPGASSSRLPVRRGPAFSTAPSPRLSVAEGANSSAGSSTSSLSAPPSGTEDSLAKDVIASTLRMRSLSPQPDNATNGEQPRDTLSSSPSSPRALAPISPSQLTASSVASPNAVEQDLGDKAEETDSTHVDSLSPSLASPMQRRKGSVGSMKASITESRLAGTRKKGPPAPLVLVPSSPSSYSLSSAGLSQPNSAVLPPDSANRPRPPLPQQPQQEQMIAEPSHVDHLGLPDQQMQARSTDSLSPYSASHSPGNPDTSNSGEAFLTPMQSPFSPASLSLQSPAAPSVDLPVSQSKATNQSPHEGVSVRDASLSAIVEGLDEQQGSTLAKDSVSESKGVGHHDVNLESKRPDQERQVDAEKPPSQSVRHRESPSEASSVGAFEYDSTSENRQDVVSRAEGSSHSRALSSSSHRASSTGSSSNSRQAISPPPNMQFNTKIFHAPNVVHARKSSLANMDGHQYSPHATQSASTQADYGKLSSTHHAPPRDATGATERVAPDERYPSGPPHPQTTDASWQSQPLRNDRQLSPMANDSWRHSSSSPVSPSTSRSTTLTSASSRSRSIEHAEPTLTMTTGRQPHLVKQGEPQKKRESQSSRGKAATGVPEVPMFGYMGASPLVRQLSNGRHQHASPAYDGSAMSPFSGQPAASNPQSAMMMNSMLHEDEVQGSSRWSSGSENEDERPPSTSKSSRNNSATKNNGRSRKSSQAAASSNSLSSRRNTSQSSAGAASIPQLKKGGLFAGLGLRKKSFSALSSDLGNGQASSPRSFPSDSAALSKAGDGMKEFPFPLQHSASISSKAIPKHMSNSMGMNSNMSQAMPSPTLSSGRPAVPAKDDNGVDGPLRNVSTRLIQRQASTPSLAERFSAAIGNSYGPNRPKQLRQRPSDASLSTTSSVQGYNGGSAVTRMNSSATSNDSALPSPVILERTSSMTRAAADVSELQGLGIHVDASSNGSLQGSSDRNGAGNGGNGSADAKDDTTLTKEKSHLRGLSLSSFRSSDSLSRLSDGHGVHSMMNDRQVRQPLRHSRQHSHLRGSRQRSMTMNGTEKASILEAKELAMPLSASAIPPSTSVFGGSAEGSKSVTPVLPSSAGVEKQPSLNHSSVLISPDETPRIPYAALNNSAYPQEVGLTQSPESMAHTPASQSMRRRGTDEEDGLFAMGQSLVRSISSPPPASSTSSHQSSPGKHLKARRRIRRTDVQSRPRYTSLTDYGREWQSLHPEEAFQGAFGPALLEMALDPSHGGQIVERSSISESGSSSGTDDYGSNEAASPSEGRKADGDRHQGSDDRKDDGDEKRRRRLLFSNEDAELSDSDNTDSDDSYGASENELPFVEARSILGSSMDAHSLRNDQVDLPSNEAPVATKDLPIGHGVSNPAAVLNKLQRSATLASSSRPNGHRKGKAPEVPSSITATAQQLDARELTARLQTVHRSRSVGHTAGAQRSQGGASPNMVTGSTAQTLEEEALKSIPRSAGPKRPSPAKPLFDVSAPMSPTGSPADSSFPASTLPPTRSKEQYRDDQQSIVSDFAVQVRKRSQSRSRMRPVAMDFSSSSPVPAMPTLNAEMLAQAIARSQSQPRHSSTVTEEAQNMLRSPHSLASPNGEPDQSWRNFNSPNSPLNANSAFFPSAMSSSQSPTLPNIDFRIFILDSQRSTVVNIDRKACARDVIVSIMRSDTMPVDERVGGWAIFDVRPDDFIERPLREYEMAADIVRARQVSGASKGYLCLKRTDLSPYLSAQALPKTSPALAGWIYLQEEGRKASWTKRWFELRDNALYHAKTDKGRDEVLLCRLSLFDVFLPHEENVVGSVDSSSSWVRKAPKKNTFALCKISQTPLATDTQACHTYRLCLSDPRAARHWITAISRARTYVLRQEQPALFAQPKATSPTETNAVTNGSMGMAPPMPAQPLVQLHAEQFERGSLLDDKHHLPERQANGIGSAPHAARPAESARPYGASKGFGAHRKPVPGSTAEEYQHASQNRAEEVRSAERQGRLSGRPLINVVADMSLHTGNRSELATVDSPLTR